MAPVTPSFLHKGLAGGALGMIRMGNSKSIFALMWGHLESVHQLQKLLLSGHQGYDGFPHHAAGWWAPVVKGCAPGMWTQSAW